MYNYDKMVFENEAVYSETTDGMDEVITKTNLYPISQTGDIAIYYKDGPRVAIQYVGAKKV